MPKQDDAQLILKLYELRREEVMRKARTWFATEFQPTSVQQILDALGGERGAYLRMITSYWEMAAAMVNHGAIDAELFHDTNGEHVYVFAKVEPFLEDLRRETGNPRQMQGLEKLIRAIPNSAAMLKSMRERQTAQAQARAAAAAKK